jgi:hypothetical protein
MRMFCSNKARIFVCMTAGALILASCKTDTNLDYTSNPSYSIARNACETLHRQAAAGSVLNCTHWVTYGLTKGISPEEIANSNQGYKEFVCSRKAMRRQSDAWKSCVAESQLTLAGIDTILQGTGQTISQPHSIQQPNAVAKQEIVTAPSQNINQSNSNDAGDSWQWFPELQGTAPSTIQHPIQPHAVARQATVTASPQNSSQSNSGGGFLKGLAQFNEALDNNPDFQAARLRGMGADPATVERRILPLRQKQQRDAQIEALTPSGADLDQQIKILTLQRMLEQQDRDEQLRLETQEVNDALLKKLNEPKMLPRNSMRCTSSVGYGGTVNTYCN